jgi:hypothetical protein
MLGVIAGDITGSQFESHPVPRPPDLPAPWPKPLHGPARWRRKVGSCASDGWPRRAVVPSKQSVAQLRHAGPIGAGRQKMYICVVPHAE